ncbi:FkbM family methyltransferase [Amaricoccus sp. HAR-UPW-R2A-40]|nr:FkbM family methyltransferase [Amaricoccus sp. HAR-UPW-R2A-40]
MVDSLSYIFPHEAFQSAELQAGGVRFPHDPAVITPAIRSAILGGVFEAREARRIPEIVTAGDRVLEIGAGIGFISTLLARQEAVETVLAVEANPHLMGYMARLHAANGVRKVRRLNVVLSDGPEPGSATFYLRRDFWMGSLMAGPNPHVGTVDVPTRNFSALLRDEAISLIVCDVEGAEAFLFDDADLSGVDRVFLELHDHLTGLSGVGAVFRTLAAKDFVYDPRHSDGGVVLFRRLRFPEIMRPYAG